MNMIEVFKEMHKITHETGNECGARFDKNGELIESIIPGDNKTVLIPDDSRAVTVVHTHPGNVTFSNIDLDIDYSRGLLWSGVILGNGEVHFVDFSRCTAPKLSFLFGSVLLDSFITNIDRLGYSVKDANNLPEVRERVLRLTCEQHNIRFSKLLKIGE